MNRSAAVTACGLILACLTLGCASEESEWQKARSADTVEALQAFLKQHPGGQFAGLARARIEELTLVIIKGRVVLQDGTPFPGVKPHVLEIREGECAVEFRPPERVLGLLEEPGSQAESDGMGMFSLTVRRAHLRGLEKGFCLALQIPADIGPAWGVVEAEKDETARHKVSPRLTLTQLKEGVRLAFAVGDRRLAFRAPEAESVMDLGDIYPPGEIRRR